MSVGLEDADRVNTVELPRFGECSYRDSEILVFPWGLPGFAHLRRFLSLQVGSGDRFLWLQSLDDLGVALPIGDPWLVFEDYAPQIPPYARAALALDEAQEFAIQCVVVAAKEGEEFTMNLLAPIVINLETRIGRQVALENSNYSVRAPIPRHRPEAVFEGNAPLQPAQEEALRG